MIHMRSGPLVATFGTLFDHITPDRWLWPHGVSGQADSLGMHAWRPKICSHEQPPAHF